MPCKDSVTWWKLTSNGSYQLAVIYWHSYFPREFILFSFTLVLDWTGSQFCYYAFARLLSLFLFLFCFWSMCVILMSYFRYPDLPSSMAIMRVWLQFWKAWKGVSDKNSILDQKTRKLSSCVCVIEASLSVDCVKQKNNCHFEK